MALPQIAILYAGVLGLMAIALGATAGVYRAKAGISIGDGGDGELTRRMRRHANFVENVPLALILIAFLELRGVSGIALHALGVALVLGRAMHWFGFGEDVSNPIRGMGAGLTALTIAISSVWCIVLFF